MKKSIILVLALVAVFAFSTVALAGGPVPGNPAWDVKYKGAAQLEAIESPRTNATGDKITSNAHSADFPGLYFYWDDKQKDDGVLLVLPEVFDLFVKGQFTLTAKNSNAYWGYEIKPDAAHKIDGVYAYGIPRNFMYADKKGKIVKEELKNINMVFIDGEYKDAAFDIVKVWKDEEGAIIVDPDVTGELDKLLSFNDGYVLGNNVVKITDYKSAWFGKKVTVTEDPIRGFKTEQSSFTITVRYDDDPIKTVTFVNQRKWSKVFISKTWLDINGKPLDDAALIAELEEDYLTFTGGYVLGKNKVKVGDRIAFGEDPIDWEKVDSNYRYYFSLEEIYVDGELVDVVDFDIEEYAHHKIAFVNKMYREPVFNPGRIPSHSHADRWWDAFGIICYSSNTTGNNNQYFVAFGPKFWEDNVSATIRFGGPNPSNKDVTVIFTSTSVTTVPVGSIQNISRITKDFKLDCKYSHNGDKNVEFANMDTITFNNVFGSGARQAYLVEVVKK
jgi:hypothetical protein